MQISFGTVHGYILQFSSGIKDFWIKFVPWECSCDEEYLEEFDKGKILT